MATLESILRNAGNKGIADQFIASATVTTMVIENAEASALAVLLFSSTAFGSASAGVAVAGTITAGTAIEGTANQVVFYNSTGAKLATCSLGTTTASDFTISSLVLGSADTLTCTSLTLTVPAS